MLESETLVYEYDPQALETLTRYQGGSSQNFLRKGWLG